jgi:phage shock protein PspC (stress-responsive transcriptional regulator)
MIGGVAGGLAEYFDLDPVVVRIIWIAATVLTSGTAIAAYVVMWLVMPRDDGAAILLQSGNPAESAGAPESSVPSTAGEPPAAATEGAPATAGPRVESTVGVGPTPPMPVWRHGHDPDRRRHRQQTAGLVLIVLGILFLAGESGLFWWIRFRYLWPLLLIALGIGILVRQRVWRR